MFSSSFSPLYMDISSGWCAGTQDLSPNVNLTFTEPVYLLYAIVRGHGFDYITGFSFMYRNSSGEIITYMTIDRILVSYHVYIVSYVCMVVYRVLGWKVQMIKHFCCGHPLTLANYNLVCMNMILSLVALELISMDAHMMKVCSYMVAIVL